MELICRKQLEVEIFANRLMLMKDMSYKVLQRKGEIAIIECHNRETLGFRIFKNSKHKFVPYFIGDYFYYNPENTRFVIVEKNNYIGKFV